MIRFPSATSFAGLPAFDGGAVLQGASPDRRKRDEPGRVWVEVDGAADSLSFYGAEGAGPPLINLQGDCSYRNEAGWAVYDSYPATSPYGIQVLAEQVARSTQRTFVDLARPGVHGSSGNHQQRRRLRELKLVDAALSALKLAFGWTSIDLAGLSGGGHMVAALMARRSDIGVAVIASGNVAVRRRNREQGRAADVTGYTDFVDPIDLVDEVARHPPRRVIVLTDPSDKVVSAACQTAYVEALRGAGVAVEHRLIRALGPGRHDLQDAAILAAVAAGALPAAQSMA